MRKRLGRILISAFSVMICTAYPGFCEGGKASGDTATPIVTTTTTTVPSAAVRKVPDTGQTQSYTDTFGEDHDYTINTPSYKDNGNGTVTDNVTGLMWQQTDDATARTWADAGAYCDNLTLGGKTDWRLPTVKELADIVNYGTYSSAIDTTAFTGTHPFFYWSSITGAGDTGGAWAVNFDNGSVYLGKKASDVGVLCVRGDGVNNSFTDNGNGTVTDGATGLTWQKQDDGTKRVWLDAISYCEALSLGGNTDWRLPNVKELKSIVDYTKYNPTIDTAFTNTQLLGYWSSTTDASRKSSAWFVAFDAGGVYNGSKTKDGYVRCVRGGQ